MTVLKNILKSYCFLSKRSRKHFFSILYDVWKGKYKTSTGGYFADFSKIMFLSKNYVHKLTIKTIIKKK